MLSDDDKFGIVLNDGCDKGRLNGNGLALGTTESDSCNEGPLDSNRGNDGSELKDGNQLDIVLTDSSSEVIVNSNGLALGTMDSYGCASDLVASIGKSAQDPCYPSWSALDLLR